MSGSGTAVPGPGDGAPAAGDGDPEGGDVRRDARSRLERRVRRAWVRGPGPLLRLASLAFTVATEGRNALWDAGLLRPARASIPVVSVGGLTVGGSGKTPLAADLAGRLGEAGTVAVVTHGFGDEMAVHRELNPDTVVKGGRDRRGAVEEAARAGARLAVVDGGFQHRGLWRDADVVAVSCRGAAGPARRLPAGPFREGWSSLGRADAVVVTRREEPARRSGRLARWLRARLPGVCVARCAFRPGRLRPANPAAARRDRPRPAVAVASIMYPEVFLRQLGAAAVSPGAEFLFPDHGGPDPDAADDIAAAAGGDGVVGTLKDAVKLRRSLDDRVPIWYLEDRLVWEAGRAELTARLRELARRGAGAARAAEDAGNEEPRRSGA